MTSTFGGEASDETETTLTLSEPEDIPRSQCTVCVGELDGGVRLESRCSTSTGDRGFECIVGAMCARAGESRLQRRRPG